MQILLCKYTKLMMHTNICVQKNIKLGLLAFVTQELYAITTH